MIVAPAAQAGTLSFKSFDNEDGPPTRFWVYEANAGEQNVVTVQRADGGFRFIDTGALTAGCNRESAAGVLCTPSEPVTVRTRDGDDTITGDGAVMDLALGGAGNDRLTALGTAPVEFHGDAGDDTIAGGPGNDSLQGNTGLDHVSGGAGDDIVYEIDDDTPETADDVLDGGPGNDTISYHGRNDGVMVDLAAGKGGERGEGDLLTGFENVDGSRMRDTLRGNDGPNELTGIGDNGDVLDGRGGKDILLGGDGDDELSGGAGNDVLRGGRGDDRYDGGAGDDEFQLNGAQDPDVVCGAGDDTVVITNNRGARLHADCERVKTFDAKLRIRRSSSAVRISVTFGSKSPCRLQINDKTVSKRGGAAVLPAKVKRVTVHPSTRCSGPLGTTRSITGFRLTS
ncbi:calcium-binding protein [Solirubrobacter soli]|uniref:calcium-binding protein n=1 Tax=Solirubrobacter soli TaxID=363832 RepID=UPI00041CD97C|nr:calcium-binding protein [Solirubrobacter soli]